MADPIRISHQHSEEEVKKTHDEVVARLEELGPSTVRSLLGHGLPMAWNQIITSWLQEKGA